MAPQAPQKQVDTTGILMEILQRVTRVEEQLTGLNDIKACNKSNTDDIQKLKETYVTRQEHEKLEDKVNDIDKIVGIVMSWKGGLVAIGLLFLTATFGFASAVLVKVLFP